MGKKGKQQLDGARPHSGGRGRLKVLEEPNFLPAALQSLTASLLMERQAVQNASGVEMPQTPPSPLTIPATMVFVAAQIWLGPPASLASQSRPSELGCSSASKNPSFPVVAVTTLSTLSHFTITTVPVKCHPFTALVSF